MRETQAQLKYGLAYEQEVTKKKRKTKSTTFNSIPGDLFLVFPPPGTRARLSSGNQYFSLLRSSPSASQLSYSYSFKGELGSCIRYTCLFMYSFLGYTILYACIQVSISPAGYIVQYLSESVSNKSPRYASKNINSSLLVPYHVGRSLNARTSQALYIY